MTTTVISVRGKKRGELLADPNFMYVGRRCGPWPASDWGNPFRFGMHVDEAADLIRWWEANKVIDRPIDFSAGVNLVDLCRQWVLANPDLRERLHELRGKTLGCWCGEWKPGDPPLGCHARVLAELANGLEGEVCSR